jgi:hypothetical protein
MGSVGNHQLTGDDGASAGQNAAGCRTAEDHEYGDENNEFDKAAGGVFRKRLPEDEQDGLRCGDGPDRSVK